MTEDDWPVPPLPNGDYYIFLARRMNLGVFGHPWEQTTCVFGRALVDAFAADPPELFTKALRVGGHSTDPQATAAKAKAGQFSWSALPERFKRALRAWWGQ